MTKKGSKKKSKESGADWDVEIIFVTMTKAKFKDKKEITGIAPEFKWGELYQMIRDHDILDVGLEDMVLY